MSLTRRSFVGSIGAGAAALATLGAGLPAADAQLVYQTTDWRMADFDKLLKLKARVKQVYDVEQIHEGGFLSPMKNSLNGLHFGFGVPEDQIKIVGALRGQANILNFDDSMWEKYKLGEYSKTDDPKTSKPAIRNVFFPKKGVTAAGTQPDVNDRAGIYHDTSLEALMGRGIQFLSCHNATEALVLGLTKRLALTVPAEETVHDLQSHLLPGVLAVPAMVAAIAMLQAEGHFSYITG